MINLIKIHALRKAYHDHWLELEENGDIADMDFKTAKDMLDTLECLWKRNHIAVDALKEIKRHIEDVMPVGYRVISDWKMADKAIREIEEVQEVV